MPGRRGRAVSGGEVAGTDGVPDDVPDDVPVDEAAATRRLQRALSTPATWAGLGEPARADASAIDVRRTHGAVLGFAGERVLKIKRPVDLGFFDFRDPERRRFFCAEEVRLNRRLAPSVYLGVAPIIEGDDGLVAGSPREPESALGTGTRTSAPDPAGVVVDHAVAMVRLPDDRMLSALLAAGTVTDADLDRIARRVARFHAEARRDEQVDAHAAPASLEREFMANAEQLAGRLEGAAAEACPPARVARVRSWLADTLRDRTPRLAARIAAGQACEGHGDLHGGNICLLGETEAEVVAFDCIEFEEAFRCGDVAREMGFLAMDLEARGSAAAADRLLASYAAASDDPDLPTLVDPFIVHYALVRAKVAVITAADDAGGGGDAGGEGDGGSEGDEGAGGGGAGGDARRWLDEVLRYGEIAVIRTLGPVAVLTCGLPGTGKSWLGAAVAERLRAEIVRSDVERKRLFGIEPTDRVPAGRTAEVYGSDATRRTYDRLIDGATAALRAGRNIVLDATYGRSAERSRTIEAIERAGGRWVLVHADPPKEDVRRWLAERPSDAANVSDADLAVHERARASFEPPDELPPGRVVRMQEPAGAREEVPRRVIAVLEAAADEG